MTYFLAILEVIINNQLCWMFIMKLLYFGLLKFSLNYMLLNESLQKQSSKILISQYHLLKDIICFCFFQRLLIILLYICRSLLKPTLKIIKYESFLCHYCSCYNPYSHPRALYCHFIKVTLNYFQEGLKHMLPLMEARIHLLQTIKQVFLVAFSILGIDPLIEM